MNNGAPRLDSAAQQADRLMLGMLRYMVTRKAPLEMRYSVLINLLAFSLAAEAENVSGIERATDLLGPAVKKRARQYFDDIAKLKTMDQYKDVFG